MLCHVERNDGCGGTQKWEKNRAAPADGINLNREEFDPAPPPIFTSLASIYLQSIFFFFWRH